MKLIIEPDDSAAPLHAALKSARKTLEIAIFRFVRSDIETLLKAAVADGVKVTALVADVNRGGEKNLRELEKRFLENGITVARTSADLIRYHDKYFIIDRRVLVVLSFNFTHLDIEHSRGFGIVTKNKVLIQEAVQLFEADCARRAYVAGTDNFVVSPANSRKVLRSFLKRAKKQLLIYDPQISDKETPEAAKNETEKALAVLVHELQPLSTTVKRAVKKVAAQTGGEALPNKMVKSTVKKVVKKAVKQAVRAAARDARKAHG